MFIRLLSQHVSGIIMPIIRKTRTYITTYGVLHWLWLAVVVWCWVVSCVRCVKVPVRTTTFTACDPAPHNHSQHNQCRTPYAVMHGLVLLMMGIMMPETCWDRSLIINIWLFASCWFLSLHPLSQNIIWNCSSCGPVQQHWLRAWRVLYTYSKNETGTVGKM